MAHITWTRYVHCKERCRQIAEISAQYQTLFGEFLHDTVLEEESSVSELFTSEPSH